jgi:putative DNA primase/helicase
VTPPPWHRGTFAPHQAVDGDFVRAAEWAAVEGITVSSSVAAEAMHAIAEESRYHPVRDYLRALTWDGVARADTWLVDFLGAADTPLNRAFASKFLIAAVARVMRPGCQVDTMLVLEGRQGLRKSTALRILAGEEHFTDHSPDIGSKDAAQQLQGIWLMEQAELATLGRADKNRVKEFISRRTDRFRPSYGRVARDFPRQCVFAATLNPGGSGYLADDTGARRFWPVLCGVGWPGRREVDSLALAGARDQLWAEAVARYDAGEPWWLADSALQADQEAATADRFDFDVWTDRVRGIVGDDEFVQTPDILERLGLKASDQNRGGQMRVAGILTALGWKAARQPRNGVQTRGYVRPDGWQPAAIAPAVDLADFL